MKKVIFLDWYKTLSYSRFWDHLSGANDELSVRHDLIKKWLFVDNKELIDPWMCGGIDMRKVLRSMSKGTELDYKFLLDELRRSCERMEICLPNIEELVGMLHDAGLQVVIATDNMDTFRKYTVPALKLDKLFDNILVSSELGVLKDQMEPAHKIAFFDDYLRSRGLGYSDAILLDDHYDTSGKYKQLKFDRILIDSPQSLGENLVNVARGSI